MGNKHGKDLIQDYCSQKSSLTKSQDIRFLTKVFNSYDKKNRGYLSEKQSRRFIDDVLNVSGLKVQIINRAKEAGKDPGEAYADAINQTFKEFDVDHKNRIELKSLLASRNQRMHDLIEDMQGTLKLLNKLRQSHLQHVGKKNQKTEKQDKETKDPKVVSEDSKSTSDDSPVQEKEKLITSGESIQTDPPPSKEKTEPESHSEISKKSSEASEKSISPKTSEISEKSEDSDISEKSEDSEDSQVSTTATTTNSAQTTPSVDPNFFWEWQGGSDDEWVRYDPETNKIIEEAFKKQEGKITLNHGFFGDQGGYELDLVLGVQKKLATNFQRPIRRAAPQPSTTVSAVWDYKDQNGEWKNFDRMATRIIEGSITGGRMDVILNHGEYAKLGGLSVDFANLTATNKKTGEITQVKRTPPLKPSKKKEKKGKKERKPKKKVSEEEDIKVQFADAGKDKKKACAKLTNWKVLSADDVPKGETCPICMCDCFDLSTPSGDEVVLLSSCVGHYFHTNCVTYCFKDGFLQCPICTTIYGVRIGTMPKGTMTEKTLTTKLPGYPHSNGTIEIKYNIPGGTQGPDQQRPGHPFGGAARTCYLPDCPEGREVLRLLKIAWDRKLTFRIGDSVATGKTDCVVWNGIHHKTNKTGGPTGYGYPDPGYLDRVKEELKAKGIY